MINKTIILIIMVIIMLLLFVWLRNSAYLFTALPASQIATVIIALVIYNYAEQHNLRYAEETCDTECNAYYVSEIEQNNVTNESTIHVHTSSFTFNQEPISKITLHNANIPFDDMHHDTLFTLDKNQTIRVIQ